jgi:hypothetical protein
VRSGVAGTSVSLIESAARPTVVVARETTWREFRSVWSSMLDEVYGVVRPAGADGAVGGPDRWQNVMLYKDDVPNVEVGHWREDPSELETEVHYLLR